MHLKFQFTHRLHSDAQSIRDKKLLTIVKKNDLKIVFQRSDWSKKIIYSFILKKYFFSLNDSIHMSLV